MPFMKGLAPVRRTLKYLEAGKLIVHPEIRVMTVNYNINQKSSAGAYDFQFWHYPQLRYKNSHLQLLRFKNMTPQPFMQLFFINGEKQIIDLYGRSRQDIHDHILNTFCIPEVSQEARMVNPANFGTGCKRRCICEVPGQVPCPGFTELPKSMRGKFTSQQTMEES